MGIEDREYLRESRPGRAFGPVAEIGAIKFLLIANSAVFVLQMATQHVVTEWLALDLAAVVPGLQIWRLVTYGFCHGSFEHILFNMFALWIFGRHLEPVYGAREFLAFYLTGVIVSGLAHLIYQAASGSPAGALGASGGVMAVVFLTAALYPRMQILFMFVIPMELRVLAALYAAADLLGAFGGGSGVAHMAHLGGAAFGLLYWKFNWRLTGRWHGLKLPRRPRWRRQRHVKLYEPPTAPPTPEDLEQRVDRVLQKIHDQGEASLTEDERALLREASRRYKSR